jgi:hypothetical protein
MNSPVERHRTGSRLPPSALRQARIEAERGEHDPRSAAMPGRTSDLRTRRPGREGHGPEDRGRAPVKSRACAGQHSAPGMASRLPSPCASRSTGPMTCDLHVPGQAAGPTHREASRFGPIRPSRSQRRSRSCARRPFIVRLPGESRRKLAPHDPDRRAGSAEGAARSARPWRRTRECGRWSMRPRRGVDKQDRRAPLRRRRAAADRVRRRALAPAGSVPRHVRPSVRSGRPAPRCRPGATIVSASVAALVDRCRERRPSAARQGCARLRFARVSDRWDGREEFARYPGRT